MKRIKLNKKRQAEFDRIVTWFLHGDDKKEFGVVDCISSSHEKGMMTAKILSRLACLQDKLTDHIK